MIKFKLLGKGSSRNVYDLGNNLVLKEAYNDAGIAQNKSEVNNNIIEDFGTKIYSWSPDYSFIVTEKAIRATEDDFIKFTGYPFDYIKEFILSIRRRILYKTPLADEYKILIRDNNFFKKLYIYLRKARLNACIDYCKITSWGIVTRNNINTLVIVDYGLNDIIYDTFYKRKS